MEYFRWGRGGRSAPLEMLAEGVSERVYGDGGGALREPLEMDGGLGMQPSLWPSNSRKQKGFIGEGLGCDAEFEVTKAPKEELELSRALSMSAGADSKALHINVKGDIVFFTGCVCVVQKRGGDVGGGGANKAGGGALPQRFYRGHDAVVTCIAMCQGDEAKAGDRLRLIASGQSDRSSDRSSPSSTSCVCFWDSVNMEERGRLAVNPGGGVVSLAFSPGGDRIACLGNDSRHTLSVYGWRSHHMVASVATNQYAVTSVVYCPLSVYGGQAEVLATMGQRHVHFWVLSGVSSSINSGDGERSKLISDDMIRPFRPLAAWENSKIALPASGRLSDVSMAEAESPAFVKRRSDPRLPGFNAGREKSEFVDATRTSNK